MAWPTSSLVPGWALCALNTTGQPAARADAVSPPAVEKASGKLLAPNTATGPSGIWRWRMSARGIGRALRQGRVDADAAEVALADNVGEEAQLAGGAGAFAGQAGGGQAGFLAGADDEFIADGLDVVRDGVQERCVGCGVQRAEGRVGSRGGGGRRRELLFGDQRIRGIELFVGGGVEAEGRFAAADDGLAGDQGMSGECHCGYSLERVDQEMLAMRALRSARSCGARFCSGGRTPPTERPIASRPPLTMDTE